MKVLTVQEPWASLIMAALKQYETRTWPTQYRGLLAIHVAKTFRSQNDFAVKNLSRNYPEVSERFGRDFNSHAWFPGCIIGVVALTNCHPQAAVVNTITKLERAAGNWPQRDNRKHFAWKMEHPRVFEEVYEVKGRLGLWNWEPPADWHENLFDLAKERA